MSNTHETKIASERNGINVHYYGKVIETVQYQNDGDKGEEKAECNVNVAKLYIGMWLYYV